MSAKFDGFDVFDQFATDPSKELEGTWIPIGPATGVLSDGETPDPATAPQILVARSGNKRHGKIVSSLYETSKTLLETKNDAAEAKGEEITIQSMAQGILMGWKNLGFKGEKLEDGYNIKDAKRLLAVKDFRDMVGKYANDFQRYKLKQEEADAKK